jgi:hypothetical protein
VRLIFADDSTQMHPSRPQMGPLVAIGGVSVPSEAVKELERDIESLCTRHGFPPREEFKWSPGRELWMRENLVGEARVTFLTDVLELVASSGAQATVIVEDANETTATGAPSAQEDVARLFLERVDLDLRSPRSDGLVIVDRPSGGRANEYQFLRSCQEVLQSGTAHVKPQRIALNRTFDAIEPGSPPASRGRGNFLHRRVRRRGEPLRPAHICRPAADVSLAPWKSGRRGAEDPSGPEIS